MRQEDFSKISNYENIYLILQYCYYYYKLEDYYNSKAGLEPQATQTIRTQGEVMIREAKIYSLIGIAMYPCTKHAKGLSLYYIDQQPVWYKILQ